MDVNKLTISKETTKSLSRRQLGELRYKRLKEMDNSGELSRVTSRSRLAEVMGYPRNNRTGIAWVNNMIHRGFVKETILGIEKGKEIKEFHLTSKIPNYHPTKAKKNKGAERIFANVGVEQKQTANVVEKKVSVVVEYREMKITIENGDAQYVGEIIKSMN